VTSGKAAALRRLPSEPVDRLVRPFTRFLRIEAAAGAVLLACATAALILSNSPWSQAFLDIWEIRVSLQVGSLDFGRSIREWINDALMTLFFFLVALELKRELVLGELNKPRMAVLSVAAALGGMVVPAGVYLVFRFGEAGAGGWGTVMATDTAFVLGCLALLGPRIPHSLRVFMLSMAVIDDLGAVVVVAIGYGGELNWVALALGALGIAAVRALALLGVRSIPLFYLIGGAIWLAVDASGVHATITGVILGLLTPARRWVSDQRLYAILDRVIAHPYDPDPGSGDTKDRTSLQRAEIAARETLSPLERLEMALHPWVGFVIMPSFALANAGEPLSLAEFGDPIAMAVFAGFILGKPIGVLSFTWIALRAGIASRPDDLAWGHLVGGAILAGIGFTMALFIASLAFGASLLPGAKLGIFVASIVAAITGTSVLFAVSHRKPRVEID